MQFVADEELVLANIHRFEAGQAMSGLVDRGLGY